MSRRILHGADIHIMQPNHRNYDESISSLKKAVDTFHETESDFFAVSGDFFDTGKPHPEAVATVRDIMKSMPKNSVVIAGGNHDQVGIHGFQRNPIDAYLSEDPWCLKSVDGFPELVDADGFKFIVTPWARIAGSDSQNDIEQKLTDDLKRLGDEVAGSPSMLMGHVALEEASFSHPERRGSEQENITTMAEALVGAEFMDSLPVSIWRLGHIHKRQMLGSKNGGYVGSSYKVSFGERNESKGFDIIDIDEKGQVNIKFHEIGVRELVQVNLTTDPLALEGLPEKLKSDDRVRILEDPDEARTLEQVQAIEELERLGVQIEYRRVVKDVVKRVVLQGLNVESSPIEAMKKYIDEDESLDPDTAARRMNMFSNLYEMNINSIAGG